MVYTSGSDVFIVKGKSLSAAVESVADHHPTQAVWIGNVTLDKLTGIAPNPS